MPGNPKPRAFKTDTQKSAQSAKLMPAKAKVKVESKIVVSAQSLQPILYKKAEEKFVTRCTRYAIIDCFYAFCNNYLQVTNNQLVER